jgi:T4 RnlA family RNA ligase
MKKIKELTLKRAKELLKEYPDLFREKIDKLYTRNGEEIKIHSFGYLYCNESDFEENYEEKKEMRGLTFVEMPDGEVKRFLSLHKFFNFNIYDTDLIKKYEDIGIKNITPKMDGSLIIPYSINNSFWYDDVRFKTKMGIDNDITKLMYNSVGENRMKEIKNFVTQIYNEFNYKYQPLFEFISPDNKIVVMYEESDLKLIQIRNNETGDFIDTNSIDFGKIQYLINRNNIDSVYESTSSINISFEDLIYRLSNLYKDNFEGFVVEFNNGQFYKFKTDWYIKHHRIKSSFNNELSFKDNVLKMIIMKEDDDFLTSLDLNLESERIISDMVKKTKKHFKEVKNKIVKDTKEIILRYYRYYTDDFKNGFDFVNNPKNFALHLKKNYDDELFGFRIRTFKKMLKHPELLNDDKDLEFFIIFELNELLESKVKLSKKFKSDKVIKLFDI